LFLFPFQSFLGVDLKIYNYFCTKTTIFCPAPFYHKDRFHFFLRFCGYQIFFCDFANFDQQYPKNFAGISATSEKQKK